VRGTKLIPDPQRPDEMLTVCGECGWPPLPDEADDLSGKCLCDLASWCPADRNWPSYATAIGWVYGEWGLEQRQ
jgi:hypothetical protein